MRPAFTRAACAAGAAFLLAAFWIAADWSDRYLMHYGNVTPSRGDLATKLNLLLFVLPATILAVRALAGWAPALVARFDRLGSVRRIWPWAVAVALTVLVLVAGVRFGVLRATPITDDENVYEFQARIFLSGRLYLESQPPEVRPFFDNQFVVNNGKWYGLYFMGHPGLLAVATRMGLGEWLGPIAAALTVLLACGSARRLFGPRVAVLTGGLLLVSPFFLTLSASHLSQPSSSLMLSLFLYAWLRLQETPRAPVWWVKRIFSRRSARWGRASMTRMLSACAPCDPPNTSTRGKSCATSGCMKFCMSSRRMGLPSWCTRRRGKWSAASGKAVKAAFTNRPSRRLVSPATAFCSCTAVGMRMSQAASTTGPLA